MLSLNRIVSFMLLLFFISGLFVATFNFASAGSVEDSWNTKTPMTQARANLGVVAVDGQIYAIGGYTAYSQDDWWKLHYQDGFCGINECYSTVTDKWVTLKPMPTSRANFAIVAYQDKIYCIGGESRNGIHSVVEVYDIVTDSWSTKKDCPFDVRGSQAHVVDGKIFVLSGRKLFMYDPVTDKWNSKTSIPRPNDIAEHADIFDAFSVVMDNKIMVYFKYDDAPGHVPPWLYKQKSMIYDPQTDMWSEGRAPPEAYSEPRLIAGGYMTTGVYAPKKAYFLWLTLSGTGVLPMIYDPVEDAWATAESISTGRTGFGVAVVDDLLYAIGGSIYGAYELVSLNEQYIPIGYHDTLPSTPAPTATPTPSNSPTTSETEPLKPSESFLNPPFVAAVLILTVGIVVVGLVFYFKQKNKV